MHFWVKTKYMLPLFVLVTCADGSSIASIHKHAIKQFEACLRRECCGVGTSPYVRIHADRYRATFAWLSRHHLARWLAHQQLGQLALDVLVLGGGNGTFERCLGWAVPLRLHTYDGDLSYAYCPLANQSADLILSLEVVEHLKDQATRGVSAHWQASGVFNHLAEMSRLLRPKGRALVTTPNLVSFDVF